MNSNRWFALSLVAAAVFLYIAWTLFAENKLEVVGLGFCAFWALYGANASGKAKIKEFDRFKKKG